MNKHWNIHFYSIDCRIPVTAMTFLPLMFIFFFKPPHSLSPSQQKSNNYKIQNHHHEDDDCHDHKFKRFYRKSVITIWVYFFALSSSKLFLAVICLLLTWKIETNQVKFKIVSLALSVFLLSNLDIYLLMMIFIVDIINWNEV